MQLFPMENSMFDPQCFRQAVRYEGGVSRRLFLAYTSALSTLPLLNRSTSADTSPTFADDPFTLGVASGEQDSQSVVLWTRLAPQPLEPGGGMSRRSIEAVSYKHLTLPTIYSV